jgi:hypothetical protein
MSQSKITAFRTWIMIVNSFGRHLAVSARDHETARRVPAAVIARVTPDNLRSLYEITKHAITQP